jgi:hypothetical protein
MLMYWFLVVLGVGAVIALALWLWWLWWKVGQSHTVPPARDSTGYSVWSFRSGRWSMVEDRSAPGFTPGPPPTRAGQFEGDSVKVTSIRKPGSS